MGTRWMASHGVVEPDYQSQFNDLKARGFQLRWLHAYDDGLEPRFNVVWEHRSEPVEWEAHHGIAAADYQDHFNQKAAQHLRLRCVSAYLQDGAVQYATLWARQSSAPWEASHGVPIAQCPALFNSMGARGFRPVHLNVCGMGFDAIVATIWEERQGPDWRIQFGLDADAFQAEFNAAIAQGFRLRQVSAYDFLGAALYAGLWEIRGGPWEGRHDRSRRDYQLDFDDLRLRGYRPSSITACRSVIGDRFAATFENREFTGDDLALINREADALIAKHNVPGLSIALTKDGRLVYAQTWGFADNFRQVPLRTRHRMRVASVSKAITAVAVYILIDRGQLKLSDRVFGPGAILDQTYGTPPYTPHLKAIEVQHLLDHTTGGWDTEPPTIVVGGVTMPNPKDFDDLDDPMFKFAGVNQAQLITAVLDTYGTDLPGIRFAYSNFGFFLLGRIIEATSGTSYEAFVQQNVCVPAGITSMTIAGNSLAARKPWEVEYVGQNYEDPYSVDMARGDAAGGWMTTAIDLVRFAVHVDGAGGSTTPLLTAASVASMVTANPLTSSPVFARGWAVTGANRWVGGGLPGTRALLVTAGNAMSFCALCNTRSADGNMERDMDDLLWHIVEGVTTWPAYDLFE